MPRLPTNARANRYAAGPFCVFYLREAPNAAGVYALTVGNEVKYIGECEDLRRRFSPKGYGSISPRNLHSDGQSTNCKINALVLAAYKAGQSVSVWFAPLGARRKSVESKLLVELRPAWNGVRSRISSGRVESSSLAASRQPTDKNRFRVGLALILAEAERSGETLVRVRSGDLHLQVGGYPGASHQMPLCCRAMKAAMASGDRIILAPPKGVGANLIVEYRLPRDP